MSVHAHSVEQRRARRAGDTMPSTGVPLADQTGWQGLLGHDFSTVRVHADQDAALSARSLAADAYTVGDHVVFGEGGYRPDSLDGRRLIAHELAHVVQQRRGGGPPPADPASSSERAAQAAAGAVASGARTVGVQGATGVGVSRQMNPRHARGYSGEQGAGFQHYSQADGWILIEGPSGSAGHSVTGSGFDLVAYNTRTRQLHLVDNKSLRRAGNVGSATAIDPSRNLAQNVDDLLARVEAARDIPARTDVIARLRATQARLAAGQPVPAGVQLVVTTVGGQSTGVSQRLRALGVTAHAATPTTATPNTQFNEGAAIEASPAVQAHRAKQAAAASPPSPAVTDPPTASPPTEPPKVRIATDPATASPATEPPKIRIATDDHEAALQEAAEAEALEPAPRRRAASRPALQQTEVPKATKSDAHLVEPAPHSAPKPPGSATEVPAAHAAPTGEHAATVKPAAAKAPAPITTEPHATTAGKGAAEVKAAGIRGRLLKYGGEALALYGAVTQFREMNKEHGAAESVAAAAGQYAGSKFVSGGAGDLAVNLANLAVSLLPAPKDAKQAETLKDVQETTNVAAAATPSGMSGALVKEGARGIVNIAKGDTKAIDRQVREMQEGKAGAPLQGYALATEVVTNMFSGNSFELSVMKAGKIGQGSFMAKVGNKAGDEAYQFINKDLPEAAEFAKKDMGRAKDYVVEKYDAMANGVANKVDAAKKAVSKYLPW